MQAHDLVRDFHMKATALKHKVQNAQLADPPGADPPACLRPLQIISIAASRHSAVATAEGHVWTMGHNNSKGGGGYGSPPMDASGQLGRGGTNQAARVTGLLQVSNQGLLSCSHTCF